MGGKLILLEPARSRYCEGYVEYLEMMMQPDDLSTIKKVLDEIPDFVAKVVFNVLVEVVMEGLF